MAGSWTNPIKMENLKYVLSTSTVTFSHHLAGIEVGLPSDHTADLIGEEVLKHFQGEAGTSNVGPTASVNGSMWTGSNSVIHLSD